MECNDFKINDLVRSITNPVNVGVIKSTNEDGIKVKATWVRSGEINFTSIEELEQMFEHIKQD